jgi:hypothetical protein
MFNDEIQALHDTKLKKFRRLNLAKHELSIRGKAGMFWQRRKADERTDREKSVAQM